MMENSLNIDLSYLELMTDGDTEMKQTMLEMLLDEIPQEIMNLKNCCSNSDWKALNEVSHKFKSTLSYVGSVILTNANLVVEEDSKLEKNLDGIKTQIGIIESHAPFVLQDLRNILYAAA
jgi:HPt (histidine-containing phosphotransfer) domain-containing protein